MKVMGPLLAWWLVRELRPMSSLGTLCIHSDSTTLYGAIALGHAQSSFWVTEKTLRGRTKTSPLLPQAPTAHGLLSSPPAYCTPAHTHHEPTHLPASPYRRSIQFWLYNSLFKTQ